MRKVTVNRPILSVKLCKTITRDQSLKAVRYTVGPKEIDLDRFLSDESSVTVSRTLNAPAGAFSITVADVGYKYASDIDSLYGLVEPMDVLEIRMCQNVQDYEGEAWPLVMRCVVSEVRRDEAMGSDGKPKRTVVISGQDWGKFLQINQIKYIKGNPDGKDWLSAATMELLHGIQQGQMSAGDLIKAVTEKIANKFLARFEDPDTIVPFLVDVSGADPKDMVMLLGYNAFPQGTAWEFFQNYGDLGPFYELFIDDTEEGPKLIYRKPPYLSLGSLDKDLNDIEPGIPSSIYGVSIKAVSIPPDHIMRLSASRSDADVAQWFWIESTRTNLSSDTSLKLMALGDNPHNAFKLYPNNDPKLYGTRTLEVKSTHGLMPQGGGAAEISSSSTTTKAYLDLKVARLRLANRDNALLESGSMVIKGNEKVKVGSYISVLRGEFHAMYYVKSVSHTFSPFRSFTTTVQFIRGTGFIARSGGGMSDAPNSYLQEIGRGPYQS